MKNLRIAIIAFVVVAIAAISIYVNRSLIFTSNLNTLTRKLLPSNIKLESLSLDSEHNRITVNELQILNPKGFRRTPFIMIPRAEITYTQRDKDDLLDGLTISGIMLFSPVIYLDRSKEGKTNIQQISENFSKDQKKKEFTLHYKLLAALSYLFSPTDKTFNLNKIKAAAKKGNELIEVKPIIHLKNATFTFDDRYTQSKGYKTTVDEIDARIELKLKKDLRGLDYIESEGGGFINGRKDQILNWVITGDPKASSLAASNTFNIQNVDLVHFRPYYDKYSPFTFESARASGKLNFSFSGGNINSLNELKLTAPGLEIKEDYPFKKLWAVSSKDLSKYFISQSGEIFFDFEIYGPTSQPKFSLGPKTKMALTRMVADKIADVLLGGAGGAEGGEKGFMQRIMDKYEELKATDQAQAQLEAQGSPQAEKSSMQKILDKYKELGAASGGEELRLEGQAPGSQRTKTQEAVEEYKNFKKSDEAKLRKKAGNLLQQDKGVMEKMIEKYKQLKESGSLEQ